MRRESSNLRTANPCVGYLYDEKRNRRMLLLLTCLMAWIHLVARADWPQWRGPDRNGVAPESPPLADAWPITGPKLVWQNERLMHAGVETGHSSPVIADGRVFLYGNWMDGTRAGANDAVACLDATT